MGTRRGRPVCSAKDTFRCRSSIGTKSSGEVAVSLYAALADAGVAVARASEVVRPGLLDPAAARHLHEPPGSPVLVSTRITYTPDAVPVVSDHATILGTMMEIRTERAATGLSLAWRATS